MEVFDPLHYPTFVLRQFFALVPELFFVAETKGGHLVGYALGAIGVHNKKGWLLSIAVDRSLRNKHIGTMLGNELISELKGFGAEKIMLTVHPDNKSAITLYQKLGFGSKEGKDAYFGKEEPRLLMTLGQST